MPKGMTEADQITFDSLMEKRLQNERWELVFGEPRVLEDITGKKPTKGWEVTHLHGKVYQRSPCDWSPIVPGTLTQLSDGTWAYLFDAGEPLKSMPKKPVKKQRAKSKSYNQAAVEELHLAAELDAFRARFRIARERYLLAAGTAEVAGNVKWLWAFLEPCIRRGERERLRAAVEASLRRVWVKGYNAKRIE